MKLAIFAALALLLGTGSAFAGAGAPVPEENTTPAQLVSISSGCRLSGGGAVQIN